jgi:uncharacterized protein
LDLKQKRINKFPVDDMSYVSIVMKGTRLCNLRCNYCHDWRSEANSTMSFEVLSNAIAKILGHPNNKLVEFVWHGGEPTLLPISQYKKIMDLQTLFKKKEQYIINRIQTNGTRLNKSWIDFIKKYKFLIGISIDGPPVLHNRQRKFADGRESFSDVSNTIKTLQGENIPFTVLMVVDKLALKLGPLTIFNFFIENNIKNYGLLAATPINSLTAESEVKHYINPNTFTNFLIKIYDIWRNYGDNTIKIREIDDILRLLLGQNQSSCTLQGSCFGKYFIIEPNGEIAHCELFQGDSRYTLGNILDMSFHEILESEILYNLKSKNEDYINKMRECKEFSICNGWCPHERYLSERYSPLYKINCCGLSDLIDHIRENPPERCESRRH